MPSADYTVSVSQFLGNWTADPGPLTAGAVGLVLFAQAFLRLRRRGRADLAPWSRAAMFGLGVFLSVFPLVSPLDVIADRYLLSAHMIEHVLLGDAGPALIVCAVRGPLGVFMLPGYLIRPVGHSRAVRRTVDVLLQPGVTLGLWVVTYGCWHIPAAYDYTLTHQTVHDLEHLTFAIAGTLVWIQLIDPTGRNRLSFQQRIAYAVTIFAFGQVLSDTLILWFHPLYATYADQPARVLGIGPQLDQRLAGVVMMVEQAITLGTCVTFLVLNDREARRRGRAAPQPQVPAGG